MNKQEFRELLAKPNQNFYLVVNSLLEILKTNKQERARVINYCVLAIKKKRAVTSQDLYKYFYDSMKDYVLGTTFIKNEYAAQMLLRNIWEGSGLQRDITVMVNSGYRLLDEGPIKDKELTVKEKRVLQAHKMRQAKAKKKAEREALESAKQVKTKIQEEKKAEARKISEEQIALLRGMSVK